MSLFYQVLGSPGCDNSLLVTLDPGHARIRLLFDCGAGCLEHLRFGEILDIDYVFFSHLHMDHVGGFDSFFRVNADRTHKPNQIFGPPESSRILQHRFQGYLWNMVEDTGAQWWVYDVDAEQIQGNRFDLSDAFAQRHTELPRDFDGYLIDNESYSVKALVMDHHTPSLAYVVREKPHLHVATERLEELGLEPGPWLQKLKDPGFSDSELEVDNRTLNVEAMRELLLTESPGQSIAYLTDFLLDDAAQRKLIVELADIDTLICESQYHPNDHELAVRHYHMTSTQAAALARQVDAQELVLIHLSNRYRIGTWKEMLLRARHVFRRTRFPDHWTSELNA